MIALTCAALHQNIPALTVGVTIALHRTPDGSLEIRTPGTPTVLARIAQAIKDGALVCDPTDWDEIERQVLADQERFRNKAESILAQLHHEQAKAG